MIMFSECFPSHFHFHSLDFAFSTHSSDSVHANFCLCVLLFSRVQHFLDDDVDDDDGNFPISLRQFIL